MIAQGENRVTLTKQLKNVFHPYLKVFQKFDKTHEEINISQIEEYLAVDISNIIFIELN